MSDKEKPKLLLVEDNRDTLVVFKKMLRDDYLLTACENAADAEKEIRANKFDLILTDLNLGPGATGQDLLNIAMVSKENSTIPVVAITAYVESPKEIDENQFSGFIVKPILQGELLDELRKALDGKRI